MITNFYDLCDICDALENTVLTLAPGAARDAMEALRIRLDAVITRVAGMEEAIQE